MYARQEGALYVCLLTLVAFPFSWLPLEGRAKGPPLRALQSKWVLPNLRTPSKGLKEADDLHAVPQKAFHRPKGDPRVRSAVRPNDRATHVDASSAIN